MAVSLNLVLAGIICVVVLSVAGATLGITMAVSLDALTAVGSERALSLTTDVADLSSSYLETLASDATSTRDIAKMLGAKPTDLAARGTNWTSLFSTSMFTALSDSNFTLFRAKIVFFQDAFWMQLLSRCAQAADSACTAWWERFPAATGTWGIGGKSVRLGTFADNNKFAEEEKFPINPDPYAGAGNTWAQNLGDKSDSCAFGNLKFYHNGNTGRWVLPAACNLHNSSGTYIGRVEYEAFIDEALGGYVNTVERSENSVLFVIDNLGRVVATTQKDAYFTTKAYTRGAPLTDATLCVSNEDTNLQGIDLREGCLLSTATFPYRPLQSQGNSFLQTPKKSLLTVTVDGESFYAVSERVKSRFGNLSFNVILFSPESDVLGDVEKGRNIAIGVTAGVFIIGAASAMFFTARLLRALTMVSTELYKMAELQDIADKDAPGAARGNAGRGGQTGSVANGNDDARTHNSIASDALRYRPGDMHRDDSMHESTAGGQAGAASGPGGAVVPTTSQSGGLSDEDRSVVSEFAALQSAYFAMNAAMRSFTKYVPKDVVRELMAKKELCTIAMEPLRCTMLFMDIANFTSMCERVETGSLSELVKLYFERMSKQVMFHGGIIDKFIGDVIMAVWGAPFPTDHQELRGCMCALGVARESRQEPLEGQFRQVNEELKIRVGVASGDVLAGNMGSDKRMSYTVIGDSVNLAARLQSFNRQWGTTTMIPDDVAAIVDKHLLLRTIVFASIVGKDVPCNIMEIVTVHANLPDLASLDMAAEQFRQSRAATAAGIQHQNDNDDDVASPAAVRSTVSRHKSASSLIRYHHKHGAATANDISFVRQYNAAATALMEKRFGDAVNVLTALDNDSSVLPAHKAHRSVKKLRELAEHAVSLHELPKENLYNNFFVYRASEK